MTFFCFPNTIKTLGRQLFGDLTIVGSHQTIYIYFNKLTFEMWQSFNGLKMTCTCDHFKRWRKKNLKFRFAYHTNYFFNSQFRCVQFNRLLFFFHVCICVCVCINACSLRKCNIKVISCIWQKNVCVYVCLFNLIKTRTFI